MNKIDKWLESLDDTMRGRLFMIALMLFTVGGVFEILGLLFFGWDGHGNALAVMPIMIGSPFLIGAALGRLAITRKIWISHDPALVMTGCWIAGQISALLWILVLFTGLMDGWSVEAKAAPLLPILALFVLPVPFVALFERPSSGCFQISTFPDADAGLSEPETDKVGTLAIPHGDSDRG